jgi:hypothetical protein
MMGLRNLDHFSESSSWYCLPLWILNRIDWGIKEDQTHYFAARGCRAPWRKTCRKKRLCNCAWERCTKVHACTRTTPCVSWLSWKAACVSGAKRQDYSFGCVGVKWEPLFRGCQQQYKTGFISGSHAAPGKRVPRAYTILCSVLPYIQLKICIPGTFMISFSLRPFPFFLRFLLHAVAAKLLQCSLSYRRGEPNCSTEFLCTKIQE